MDKSALEHLHRILRLYLTPDHQTCGYHQSNVLLPMLLAVSMTILLNFLLNPVKQYFQECIMWLKYVI